MRRRLVLLGSIVAAVALAVAGLAVMLVPRLAHAAPPYQVTNCATYGTSGTGGDLADAIAKQGTTPDIQFACNGTITVPPITITASGVELDGNGHTVALDGNHAAQVLYVAIAASLTLNDLTIENGTLVGASSGTGNGGNAYGAGVNNEGGTLTITNCTFSGNSVIGGAATAASFSGGAGAGGAIYNDGGAMSISNSQFSGNSATGGAATAASSYGGDGEGGAIFNDAISLTITNGSFSANTATAGYGTATGSFDGNAYGGAVVGDGGTLTISGSTFTTNRATAKDSGFAQSGAIAEGTNTASISDSTFSGNSATSGSGGSSDAGAVASVAVTGTINGSTFSGNSATSGDNGTSQGGALITDNTQAISDSTITGNSAISGDSGTTSAGGVYVESGATTLTAATLANDIVSTGSSGTIYGSELFTNEGGSLNPVSAILAQTIIANSVDSVDPVCETSGSFSTFTDGGYNLERLPTAGATSTCGFTTGATYHDVLTTTPSLDSALADNGSTLSPPTQTLALLPGSIAIDSGPATCAPASDQRGISRPQGAACDIGAYEFAPATVTSLQASPTSAMAGQSVTLTATVTPVIDPPVPGGSVTFKNGSTTLGTSTLGGGGTATFSTSGLAVGTHSLTATYNGAGARNYTGSTSAPVTVTISSSNGLGGQSPSTGAPQTAQSPAAAAQTVQQRHQAAAARASATAHSSGAHPQSAATFPVGLLILLALVLFALLGGGTLALARRRVR